MFTSIQFKSYYKPGKEQDYKWPLGFLGKNKIINGPWAS